MQPDIEIYIDRLVLHDYDQKAGPYLGEALQQELTRLLIARGLPANIQDGIRVDQLQAGTIAAGQQPRSAGRQIARQIYRQINPTTHEK